jgi:hypothetical protein
VKRRLFNAGALMSLVVFMAMMALWVSSYWHEQYLSYSTERKKVFVYSRSGSIEFGFVPPFTNSGLQLESTPATKAFSAASLMDFGYGRDAFEAWLLVPHWVLFPALLATPGVWLFRRRAGTCLGRAACPACGYDLRGTPGSKTCPECGFTSPPAEPPEPPVPAGPAGGIRRG